MPSIQLVGDRRGKGALFFLCPPKSDRNFPFNRDSFISLFNLSRPVSCIIKYALNNAQFKLSYVTLTYVRI